MVSTAVLLGIPTPAFSASLAFYDSYRSAVLPANLIQAQRDYFGAHTYELNAKIGDWVHSTLIIKLLFSIFCILANWTGHGGRVTSNAYEYKSGKP